jgi:hypothetical protein
MIGKKGNSKVNTSGVSTISGSASYLAPTAAYRSRSTPRKTRQDEIHASPTQKPPLNGSMNQSFATTNPSFSSSSTFVPKKAPATLVDLSEDEKLKINRVIEKLFEMTSKYEDTLQQLHKERDSHQNEINQIYEKINGQLLIIEDKMKLKDHDLQSLRNKEHILSSLLILYQKKLSYFYKTILPEKESSLNALQQQFSILQQEKSQLVLISGNDKTMITLLESELKEKNNVLHQNEHIKIPKLELLLQQEITKTRQQENVIQELNMKNRFQLNEIEILQKKILNLNEEQIQKMMSLNNDINQREKRVNERNSNNNKKNKEYYENASDRDNDHSSVQSEERSSHYSTSKSRNSNNFNYSDQQQSRMTGNNSLPPPNNFQRSMNNASVNQNQNQKKYSNPKDDSTINYDVMFDTSNGSIHYQPEEEVTGARKNQHFKVEDVNDEEDDYGNGHYKQNIASETGRRTCQPSHTQQNGDNREIQEIARKYLEENQNSVRPPPQKNLTGGGGEKVVKSYDTYEWKQASTQNQHQNHQPFGIADQLKRKSISANNSPARNINQRNTQEETNEDYNKEKFPFPSSTTERKRRTTETNNSDEIHPMNKRPSSYQDNENNNNSNALNNSLNITSSTISSFFVSPDHPGTGNGKKTTKSGTQLHHFHLIDEIDDFDQNNSEDNEDDDEEDLTDESSDGDQQHHQEKKKNKKKGTKKMKKTKSASNFIEEELKKLGGGSAKKGISKLFSEIDENNTEEKKLSKKGSEQNISVPAVTATTARRKSVITATAAADHSTNTDNRRPLSEKDKRRSSQSLRSIETLDSLKNNNNNRPVTPARRSSVAVMGSSRPTAAVASAGEATNRPITPGRRSSVAVMGSSTRGSSVAVVLDKEKDKEKETNRTTTPTAPRRASVAGSSSSGNKTTQPLAPSSAMGRRSSTSNIGTSKSVSIDNNKISAPVIVSEEVSKGKQSPLKTSIYNDSLFDLLEEIE